MENFGIGSLSCYADVDKIGEGSYGYVFKARDIRDNSPVALKRLIIHRENSGFPLSAIREIKFLKALRHKNIVNLRDVINSKGSGNIEDNMTSASTNTSSNKGKVGEKEEKDKEKMKESGNVKESDELVVDTSQPKTKRQKMKSQSESHQHPLLKICNDMYFVFDFVEHDLSGLIESQYKFTQKEIKCVMKQMFEVLEYLTDRKVLHRDIKSSNILITNFHVVKLADFGLSRSTQDIEGREDRIDMTSNVVTRWYKPPELLLGTKRYSYAIDMWSTGCVMAELELGRPIFPGRTELEQYSLITSVLGVPDETNWPGMELLSVAPALYLY